MSASEEGHAICPDCGGKSVTIQTAPLRPPRLYCDACRWTGYPTAEEPSQKA